MSTDALVARSLTHLRTDYAATWSSLLSASSWEVSFKAR
jgi:hypothetical protein